MSNTAHAQRLCKLLAPALKDSGLFIGLTGGCLYNEGDRKDIDLVLYRNRQEGPPVEICVAAFLLVFNDVFRGLVSAVERYGFVTKIEMCNHRIDVLFPEHVDDGSTYTHDGEDNESDTP